MYLEATALLALCHIREGALDKAEPYIAEVLRDDKYIRSKRKRREFHKQVIRRFDEEGALAILREQGFESLDVDEIHEEAGKLLQIATEDEMYIKIADAVPNEVVDFIKKIDKLAKNQLPPADVKYLPPSPDYLEKRDLGRTIFSSVRRVIWSSLCDSESEVYKLWSSGAVAAVFDKKYIAGAVTAALIGQSLGYKMLAVTFTALVMKLGIDMFCEIYHPENIMSARDN